MRPTPVITSFRDALGLAMELSDEFAFANAALLADTGGRLFDGAVFDGVGQSIDAPLGWLEEQPAGARVVLVSVQAFDPDIVREQDLIDYREARHRAIIAGHHLIDWVETDGDLFRSYAYVVHPSTAWLDDPPNDRVLDSRPP